MSVMPKFEQNEKVVKLQICEIIYERNFENNFIVFCKIHFSSMRIFCILTTLFF